MARSSLTDHVALSPNHYGGRAYRITKITPHHMAGNLTVEQCGRVFSDPSRQASSNYGIGSDGRIGCYVDEADAAWTSSDWDNDNRAVTIEVANSECGGEWPVSGAAWDSLVELCADICRRNGIPELTYTGDARGNLTEHRMFAATGCPGPYLHARMGELARQVNEKLNGDDVEVITDNDVDRIAAAVAGYKYTREGSKDGKAKWGPEGYGKGKAHHALHTSYVAREKYPTPAK